MGRAASHSARDARRQIEGKRIECVFFVDFYRKIIDQFRIVQGMRRFFE
jgi:hypothetical protein